MASTVREWNIGDGPPPGYRLVRESYPLPPTRPQVVEQISSVLDKGMVQRLLVQVRQPIQVVRLVKESEADPEAEGMDLDIFQQARNAEMVDFPPRGLTAYETLFFAFRTLGKKDLVPLAVLVRDPEMLVAWLGLSLDADEVKDVFGVPIRVFVGSEDDFPDDVLLLTAATKDEPDSVFMSLRLAMDLPKERR